MYEDQEDFRNSYCKSGPNNTNQSLEKVFDAVADQKKICKQKQRNI
jgi:hypothetical protein